MPREVFAAPLLMAPMSGVTDVPFRERLRRWGCEALWTELISASALVRKHRATLAMADPPDRDDNMAVQLFGAKPDELALGASMLAGMGWKRLDFNMGCPVRKVVATGAGAGLMKNLPLAGKCISALRTAPGMVLTVKMRLGWSPSEENFLETARLAVECGVDGIVLHPRYRSQGYSGTADWSKIDALAREVKVPVAGSGDVRTAGEAVQRLREYPVKAVMIGRGALSEPWIFREAKNLLSGEPVPEKPSPREVFGDLLVQFDRLIEQKGERAATGEIKKFAAWALRGFNNSTEKRRAVMEIKDPAGMRDMIRSFEDLDRSENQ